jgi:hypothetical protein
MFVANQIMIWLANVITDKLAWFEAFSVSEFVLLCDCTLFVMGRYSFEDSYQITRSKFQKTGEREVLGCLVSSFTEIHEVQF